MAVNSLLQESKLRWQATMFGSFSESDFVPAIEQAINEGKADLQQIKNNEAPASFANTIEALDASAEKLDRVLAIFYNLFSAEASDELQALAPQVASLSANFYSDINLDAQLFDRVRSVYEQRDKLDLDPEQKTLLQKFYDGFVRNGALLDDEKKAQLRSLDERLAQLGPRFSENVLRHTNAFELVIEKEEELSGLPLAEKEAARELAREKGLKKKAWIFNLDAPSFIPFLKFSDRRELREQMWRAYRGRCVGGEYDNLSLISEIIHLRHQRAALLGFKNHADYVLRERMAKTPEQVHDFLSGLLQASRDTAQAELQEVQKFAEEQALQTPLKAWDFAYYSEKLKQQKYDFDEEKLRPYLPVQACIDGAFALAERLFGIRFVKQDDLPVYHPDVQVYEVYEQDSAQFVGLFYADFFPRNTKRGGAWMTSYRSQYIDTKGDQRPHVSIVCNFTKPGKDRPALLSFAELETLFHEFGHSLHGLLSKCRYRSLSGTNVYWDFVELPSQFMENWLLEKEVLDGFAAHYQTGEKIPQEMIDKLQASAKFQSGYQSLRQLNFALLDMAWHGQYLEGVTDVIGFENAAIQQTELFPYEEGTCYSSSFSHIFAGGYSAGYYSYKWAEVLDADAFEYFKAHDLFSPVVAKSFKENILQRGGSEDPAELYRRFRGQDPDPNALLRRDRLLAPASF